MLRWLHNAFKKNNDKLIKEKKRCPKCGELIDRDVLNHPCDLDRKKRRLDAIRTVGRFGEPRILCHFCGTRYDPSLPDCPVCRWKSTDDWF